MNMSLTPELESLVHEKVQSGLYNSASEFVREALRLLNDRDMIQQPRLAELRREIAVGLDDLKHGGVIPGGQVFAELKPHSKAYRNCGNGERP
jgi:antitoxin ParD1/3/4